MLLGYLGYAHRTHKCTRNGWVGAGMWWVQDSEKYGSQQVNDSRTGDRNSKSVPAGDTDQNLGAETINQPSEVETINQQSNREIKLWAWG